jgi:hypothetical protein
MNEKATFLKPREETPVDDVRRIRSRLDAEAGGDVHKLAEESRRVAEQYREMLDLKPVTLGQSQQEQTTNPAR